MISVKHEGDYDPELNIVFTKFINKPQSNEDIDFIVSENTRYYQKGGKNKVWNIADISEMGMAPVKIVKAYQEKDRPVAEKYIIDYCVVCSKPLEKIAAQLFNIMRGEKHPVFKTRQEALDWVLKEQETRGRFISL